MQEVQTVHVPVLLQEVIDILAIKQGSTVVDCTAGGGGHACAILEQLGPSGRYVGVDADVCALERVRARVGEDARVTLVRGNFRTLDTLLDLAGVEAAHAFLFDLGLSSDQLSGTTRRGFSFQRDEPLVMTFAADQDDVVVTAYDVVNSWDESTLADILYGFGDERRARKIARAIVEKRTQAPIETTAALAAVVESVVPRIGRVHPATRTFQAIRMAVNDELGALEAGLSATFERLSTHGRVAVISFHSLEDRMVKRTFRAWGESDAGTVLTKKPIIPTPEECNDNPRARSAKLRAFERH